MEFNWISKQASKGVATIYESNITLNKTASIHFETAYNVMLGLAEDKKLIAIKPLSKEQATSGTLDREKLYKISVKPSYSRISNKNFIKEVMILLNLDFEKNQNYKFSTKWRNDEKLLIVDLNDKED